MSIACRFLLRDIVGMAVAVLSQQGCPFRHTVTEVSSKTIMVHGTRLLPVFKQEIAVFLGDDTGPKILIRVKFWTFPLLPCGIQDIHIISNLVVVVRQSHIMVSFLSLS